MKTDVELKKDVSSELEWDPSINASHVGVTVNDGIVTLSGHLETHAEKAAIERAVARVRGVKAIAIELDVKLDANHKRSDSEIAAAADQALKWHAMVPGDRIRVKVEKGWVTLKGEVVWDYQRRNAEKSVRSLIGVVGVTNAIALNASTTPDDVAHRIREALTRRAAEEAGQLEVIVDGGSVTLRGMVDSWAERSEAHSAAWSAPGVSSVVNEIEVRR